MNEWAKRGCGQTLRQRQLVELANEPTASRKARQVQLISTADMRLEK